MPGDPLAFRDTEPGKVCCLACGYAMDAARQVSGEVKCGPCPGALSLCAACGNLAIYVDDRLIREPSSDELEELQKSDTWPMLTRAQELIRSRGVISKGGRR